MQILDGSAARGQNADWGFRRWGVVNGEAGMDRRKLALIHIVKKELKLSDEEYHRILREEAGVESSKNLTEEGFQRLMRHLVRSRHYVLNRNGLTLRQKLYIEHLRNALGWDAEHLSNFLHKYFKQANIMVLSRVQASNAITALKHILEEHRSGE